MEIFIVKESSFGKETKKTIKNNFKGQFKLKQINNDLIIIKSSDEKRIGTCARNGKGEIIITKL